jgi:hypothetical protein
MKLMKTFGSIGLTLLTCVQILFLILMAGLIHSGIDQKGDLPGLLRFVWLIGNGLLWSLMFGIVVVVSMVRNSHRRFLTATAVLVVIRIASLCHEEVREALLCLWFPIEAFAYLLCRYPVSLQHRFLFTCTNLGLYGIQLALAMKWLI